MFQHLLMVLKISNRDARRLWLTKQGLANAPTGALDLLGIINALGMVQLDTIQVISRAQHHILWSRNQNYREPMLNRLMQQDRAIFEHFTHDAAVIPMSFLPMWQRHFSKRRERMDKAGWYKSKPGPDECAAIKDRIAREGPLSTHDFDTKITDRSHAWARPPHKLALDYMWHGGELATCHRDGFTKVYDVAERIYPDDLRQQSHSDETQIDWLNRAALSRLGFGTTGEIQRFWETMSAVEAKAWAAKAELTRVSVEGIDGCWSDALALPDIEDQLAAVKTPTSRLRILNPFDPVVRDRARALRLFGFDYRIEIFVPKAKRKYGYYVYPLLEGDRFVGRLEARADRSNDVLLVSQLWPEPGVRWGDARMDKLRSEAVRIARLAGVGRVEWI